jgi:chromate transport protein ChrA
MSSSFFLALRAGLTGLISATMIYFLWKISIRLSGFLLPEKYSDLVIAVFAILLWTIWFAVAQVILVAYDETIAPSIHSSRQGQNYILPARQRVAYERK